MQQMSCLVLSMSTSCQGEQGAYLAGVIHAPRSELWHQKQSRIICARFISLKNGGGGDLVSMGVLADTLGVVPGTVTTMVKRLAKQGLVTYEPYSGPTN